MHNEWHKISVGECDRSGHSVVKLALLAICVHEFSESALKPAKPPGFQANEWEALSPGGSIPSARREHTAVWSDTADGFYVFGGFDGGSRCLSGATFGNCCEFAGTVKLSS